MARAKLEVNATEFQRVVNELESQQQFPNLTTLWKAVEATEWARNIKPHPLKASTAIQKARELKITFQTKAAKKGRPGGFPAGSRVSRKKGVDKMSRYADSFARMKEEIPEKFHPLVERAEKGSKIAMIKLKCLDCVAWEYMEVKLCTCISCPLYPIRPYQGGLHIVEAEEVDDESC